MPEWVNIVLRSISMFVLVIVTLRLAGRKVAARMTNVDVAFAVIIGVIAAVISLNLVTNLAYGLLALFIWGLAVIGLSYASLKSKWIRDLVHGREAVVIKHGKIMEEQLKKVRYSPEDLLQQLRHKNIFNVADVEFAVMEADGEVNVLLKTERQPLTAKDIGITTAPTADTQTVILDGNIMDEPLGTMGLNRQWLKTELDKIGISAENVFIGQVNSVGELYLDLFDDAIQVPKPTTRQLLAATLEKASADLSQFALDTQNEDAKKLYRECREELDSILNELKPLLNG